MFVNNVDVIDTLNLIANSPFDYILLRNTENELPYHLKERKDIDILLNSCDQANAISYFCNNGFKPIAHPAQGLPKVGAITDFDFLVNDNNIILDLNYQLFLCNSARTAFTLHSTALQRSIWEKVHYSLLGDVEVRYIDPEIEFVISFLRCCIDKRKMSRWNFSRLCEIYENSNDKDALFAGIAPYYPDYLTEIARMFETKIWSDFIIIE